MEAAGVLSSAFGLGILLHASQAAFFSAINGHVKTLFLHRRRLALLAFQLCVSLYSIFQFASLLLLTNTPCRIAVRFTLLFDQCARIAILGLGIWKVIDESAFKTEKIVWIVVMVLRVFLGGVVVSFTRDNFIPVCFPEPEKMSVGYIAVGSDIVLWILVLLRIVRLWGLFADQGRGGRSEGKGQGYGMFLIALSVLGWSVGSFPYLLRVGESIFVRMIPYILTLGLALGVLALFPSIVFSVPLKSSDGFYGSRMQRLGPGGGSPQRARSSSSPAFKQSPPRAGDIESNKYTAGFYPRDTGHAARDSNVFGGIIGAPIVQPGTTLPWSLDNTDPDNRAYPGGPIGATSVALQEKSKRKSLVETLFPAHAGGRAGISGPILRDGGFMEPSGGISSPRAMPATTNPFPKVRTVSLYAAKEAERQRIDAQFERDQKKLQEGAVAAGNSTTPTISKSIPVTPKSGMSVERTTSVKRKPVFPKDTPGLPPGPAPRVSAVVGKRGSGQNKETEIGPGAEPETPSSLRESVLAAAVDAGWGAVRYSTNTFVTDDDDTTRYTAFSNLPHPLRAPPREVGSEKAGESTDGDAKILFVNEIVYDHPALVDSLVRGPDAREGKRDVGLTTCRYSGTSNGTTIRRSPSSAKRPQLPTTQEVDEIPPVPDVSALVMDRPRHVRKDSGRGIFPPARDSEIVLEMKLKKSVNTSKSLPPRPPPTEPLPPLPVQSEELPVPATAPAEAPREQKVDKKPTELVFPIPPPRVPSGRKLAPHQIATEPLGLVSPEFVCGVPSPPLTEPKPRPQEEILSVAPSVPERSKSCTSIISPFLKDGFDSATVSDAAYETAKAWIASVASVRMSTDAPILVNVGGGHRVSYPKYPDRDSLPIKPFPTFTHSGDSPSLGRSDVSDFTSSTVLRKSVLSFIVSPKVTHGDGDVTDVEIDSDSEIEDEEDNYEGGGGSSGDTEATQSDAGEMIGAGGEGYSTEDDEEDDEYLTESDSQEFLDHRDEVVISGMDDGAEFGKIEMAERKLNAKMDAIANAIPNMSAFPRHFNIGDHIPTFSESRGKYGSKRKPPPSPLGFLMRQRRMSRQLPNLQQDRIQARLTTLSENVNRNVAVLDDLLAKIPAEAKSNRSTRASLASDGRNSLIAKLEQEMGQQENQWHGMQEVLQRNSSASVEDSRPSSRFSTNLAQRRSLIEKLSSGIDRRLSTAQNSNTTVSRNASRATSRTTSTLSSSMTAGAWKRQLAEAQIEYLQHAPWKGNNTATTNALVKPSAILKSQDTPVSVVSESEEYGYGSVSNSEDGDYEGSGGEEGDIILYDGLEVKSPVLTGDKLRRKPFYDSGHASFLMRNDGEETVAISIETASGSLAYGSDEEFEEYEVEGYLETLPATVYSPSMQSEVSATYFSPSMRVASPAERPTVSLLWNPQSIPREKAQDSEEILLWSKDRRSTSTGPLTRPAVINARPLQRVPLEPLTISSTELWKVRSTEPLSPRSVVSIEICLSPSIKELSPNPGQAVSFLWSPQSILPQIRQSSKLWSYHPLASEPPIAPPAAIGTRPRQSISLAPLRVYSTRLWCKPRSHPAYNEGGLWTNRKAFRPKSIITPRLSTVAPKSNRKSKRVTFVEEVVTVEPTGFFGKLKKLWGMQETVSVKKIVEVPVKSHTDEAAKIQAQSNPKEQEKVIADILQEITLKHQNKALQPARGVRTLWSKNIEARRQSTVPTSKTDGMWTVPSPKAAPRGNEFKDNISAVHMKRRFPALSGPTTTQLWETPNSSEVHVESDEIANTSVNLWSPAHKVHPPPKAVILDDFDVLDAETENTSLSTSTTDVTGGMRTPQERKPAQSSGWLLEEKEIVASPTEYITGTPTSSTHRLPEFVQEPAGVAPVESALWTQVPTTVYSQTSGGLWRYQAKTLQCANRSPRANLNDSSSVRKPHRSIHHILAPVGGSLWKTELTDKSHPQLWTQSSTENGLWNGKGSTEALTEIDALLRNANSLWTRHGKYVKPIFDNHSLVSFRSKRRPSTRPLKSVHGTLWKTPISSVTNHEKNDYIWGLLSSRRGVDQGISETPPLATLAQEAESPVSPIQVHKHILLWQPGDGPTQPAHSPITLVTPPKSNKRHDSPLFLALPPATGSMWTSPTSKPNPCPPRLWTPSSVILRGLWSLNNKTSSLVILTRKKSLLWSKHNAPKPVFTTLATESRRASPARPDVTVLMAGPLWTSSPAELQQPQLWKSLEKTDEKLWTSEGRTPLLSRIADPKVEKTPLWSKENSIIAPIFSGLSLVSLRSKRDISTKTLPVVEEGLWTKRIDPPKVSRDTTGLWGAVEEPPKVEAALKHVPMLWNKEGITTPIFAHLPTDSARSKKDTSSIVLQVFTEPMWKKEVVLRAKPELWKPPPKPTGLWDAGAKTKTLAQMSLERKAKGSPLWKKEGARRTTNSVPIRTNTAVRLPDKTALPKMVGGLWKPKIAAEPVPQLWARRRSMKVEKQPVGVLLWARETALRTTEAIPERTRVSFTPSDSPLPKVSGNLWQNKTPERPKGLWKRPTKTVSSTVLQPSAPLWSREKASRRTAAVPERFAPIPKKTFPVQADLPKASGTLWKPKAEAAPKGLWVKPAVIATKPIAIRTILWTAASASRTTSAAPARSSVPKRVIEEPLPVVSGNMWQKKSPEISKGLWKREIKTIGAFRKTASTPLWSKEGAARTTTAIPERAPFVPKLASTKPLEPAVGDLWRPEPAEKEVIRLWKQKPVVSRAGVWNIEGTTPSLAEIKWELAAKYTLWQRRSVLAARGANRDISSNRSSFIQRKSAVHPIHLDTAQSDPWRPTEGSADDDDTSWMITNTPPTGTLSRTSTLSDISEISPPTSAVDVYEPRIKTHSKNSSISSTSGLWRPLSDGSSSKKAGLWSNDETSAPFVNLIGDIRTESILLPAQREKPLETFDSSHNLWQPEILCDPKTIRSNSDASDYCTGGSVSEFSDDSFYSAMGAHSEHGGEENTPSNVFVGQFRRDNYIIHSQAPEQKLAEDSPFASNLRIPSLRRKLRPTEERKGRNTGVTGGQISEAETTEKVVAPSAGYL